MKSDKYETAFFNEQIVLAVQSLGFEDADADFTLKGLDATFGNRCTPPATVIPAAAGAQLQSICISENCPLDPNATCSAYPDDGVVPFPEIANATIAGAVVKENDTEAAATASTSGNSSASATGSGSTASASGNSAAASIAMNNAVKIVGTLVGLVGAGLFANPL